MGSPFLGEASRGTPVAAGRDVAERPADAPRAAQPDLVASVASLTQKLASGAGGVDEWRRLARAQADLGRWQDSAESYRRLAALTGGSTEDAAGYGEVLVLAAKGVVTPVAHSVFSAVAKLSVTLSSAALALPLESALLSRTTSPLAAIELTVKTETTFLLLPARSAAIAVKV